MQIPYGHMYQPIKLRMDAHTDYDLKIAPHHPSLIKAIIDDGDMDTAINDVLEIFEDLNAVINRLEPISGDAIGDVFIPIALVYQIDDFVVWMREFGPSRPNQSIQIQNALEQIQIAWLAVLSGDIDCIKNHVVLEMQCK